MLGAIIGDIIGSRFEFNNTDRTDFDLFTDQNSFTDDTVCTVAIADALLTPNTSYKASLCEWCWNYPHPMGGYGSSFNTWLHQLTKRPYNSYGNGSAMRVSAIGWWYRTLSDVRIQAEMTAKCTHNHPEGIKGAVSVAEGIFILRRTHDINQFIQAMDRYYPGFMDRDYSQQRGIFDETCQGTVPLSLWIVATSTSFESTIRKAISWGGDSDTIGAITGALAESMWGIPKPIVKAARSFLDPEIRTVVQKFYCTLDDRDDYSDQYIPYLFYM